MKLHTFRPRNAHLSIRIFPFVVGTLKDTLLDQFFFAGDNALELSGRCFVVLLLLSQFLIYFNGAFRHQFLLLNNHLHLLRLIIPLPSYPILNPPHLHHLHSNLLLLLLNLIVYLIQVLSKKAALLSPLPPQPLDFSPDSGYVHEITGGFILAAGSVDLD